MVQKSEELENLYRICHKRFVYSDGVLYYKLQSENKKMLKGVRVGHVNNAGYMSVGINYKKFLIHRIIFLMFNRQLPDIIDHIDRDCSNNKIENLRAADKKINSWNRNLQSNNKSGFRGVSWSKQSKKWHSCIRVDGKRLHLGFYNTPEEASKRYEEKRDELARDEIITL